MITLIIKDIEDQFMRENLKRIQNEFRLNQPILRGSWKFFELTFTKAVTHQKISHSLGFTPKDVLQTSVTGAGTITFNYTKFDQTYIDVTTTGACVVRCFIGTYKEGSV